MTYDNIWRTVFKNGARKFLRCAIGACNIQARIIPADVIWFPYVWKKSLGLLKLIPVNKCEDFWYGIVSYVKWFYFSENGYKAVVYYVSKAMRGWKWRSYFTICQQKD